MKNRVILNGQGVPVVPKSDKIAAEVAQSDLRAAIMKVAADSYLMGADTALECMTVSLTKAKEAGHEIMKIDDGMALMEEVRKLIRSKTGEATKQYAQKTPNLSAGG